MSGSNGDADDAAQEKSDPLRTDRRGFFRGSALAAAGVAAGAALGFGANATTSRTTDDRTAVPGERPEGTGFDHLVVLMFENRSFDNLLGYLYASPASSTTSEPVPTGQTFEGLNTGTYSNAAPDGTRVEAHPYEGPTDTVMMSPQPDPGEEYPFVNTQLFNTVDPSHNTYHELDRLRAPFNAPVAGTPPTMDGFLRDYVLKWMGEHGGTEPTPDEYRVIMGSFVPSKLQTHAKRQMSVHMRLRRCHREPVCSGTGTVSRIGTLRPDGFRLNPAEFNCSSPDLKSPKQMLEAD